MNFYDIPGLSQTHMEAWFQQMIAQYNGDIQGGIISKMHPTFLCCDFRLGESIVSYDVLDWELGLQNMVQNGIISTGFDTSLGMIAHYYAYPHALTTVNLYTSFLQPIEAGTTIVYHSKIKSYGRSLVTLEGEAMQKGSSEIIATATATFKILHRQVSAHVQDEAIKTYSMKGTKI